MPEKEITLEFKKPELFILIIFLGLVLFLDARVTIQRPINFGDEGYHTRTAQWIAEKKDYFAWMPFFGPYVENRPRVGFGRLPLWNLTEAGFYLILGFHEIVGKLLPPIISFFMGLSVYLLVKQLYNKEIGFIASIISVTIPSLVTYSVLLYTDVLFTFYFSLFVFTLILYLKKNDDKYLFLSSVFCAFSFLTKTPGLTAYVFLGLVFLYELLEKKKFQPLIGKYFIVVLILISIIGTFFLRSLYYFKTPMCDIPLPIIGGGSCTFGEIKEDHTYEKRTEEVGTETSVLRMGLMNYLDFAYGNIWLVTLGLISGLVLMFIKRDKIDLLILLSLSTIIFIFLIGILGRAEDTARYILGWVPIIAVITGRYFAEVYSFIGKYQKYLALLVFVFVLFVSFQNLKEKTDVMMQVKKFSPMYFQACDWIKENTPKNSVVMTIWSNRAVYNCQRTVVGNMVDISLSTDVNYTLNKTKEYGVTHIFLHKFSLSNEPMSEKYTIEFAQFLENNPEHFVNVFENGPKLQECLQQGGCDGNIVYQVKY